MKKTVYALAALALAITASGCSSAADEEAAPSAAEATQNEGTSIDPLGGTPSAAPTEKDVDFLEDLGVNDRGNVTVEENEQAVFKDPKGDAEFAEFTATNVTTNFKCTAKDAQPSINGQYVALDFDVNANEDLAESGFPYFYLSVHEFRAWDAKGEPIPDPVGNAESCITDKERVPSPIDPGDSEKGLVVLDVPKGAGTASFTLGGFQGSYGWEWSW